MGPGAATTAPRGPANIHATEQDRARVRATIETTTRARDQVRELRRTARLGSFRAEEARASQARVRSELESLEQRHAEFANGLAARDREAIQDRLRDMDQIRESAHDHQRELDAELAKDAPDRARVAEQARELAREMRRLELSYRDLGID